MVPGRVRMSGPAVERTERSWAVRCRATLPTAGICLAVAGSFLLVTLTIHLWKGVDLGDLTRDPADISGVPVYIGFLSNIGMLFWAATVAICFFVATFVARSAAASAARRFLYASGLLTLLLLFDDLFQLHERVFPLSLGVAEPVVFGGYLAVTLLYLVHFRRVILESDYLLLALALGFFGLRRRRPLHGEGTLPLGRRREVHRHRDVARLLRACLRPGPEAPPSRRCEAHEGALTVG
jgi:hypothetical protein